MTMTEQAQAAGVSERQFVASGLTCVTTQFCEGYGGERLRAWFGAGCPEPNFEAFIFVGDDAIASLVLSALRQMPKPVAHHVLETIAFIGIGREAAGQFVARPPAGRQQWIIVDGSRAQTDEEVRAIVAHESAHAWHHLPVSQDLTEPTPYLRAREAEAFFCHVALGVGQRERVVGRALRSEFLAADLARQWQFVGFAADPGHATRHVAARFDRLASIGRAITE